MKWTALLNMTEYEITYPDRLRFHVREWWQYRELFWFLAWRDIKVKYRQTLLGIGWAILQPLALMILFSLFWKWVIHIDTGVPYPVFVYSGLVLWGLFASGVANASNSMIDQANVIKKVYFPRIIVPAAAILVSLLDFFITLFLYLALLIFYDVRVKVPIFLMFSAICLLIVFISTLGCGLFFAAVNIRYRDVRHAIPFLLQLLFFATPVIFPLSVVKSEALAFLLSLNPMAAAIHLARAAISIEAVNWQFALTGLASSFLLFLIGLAVFNRNEIDCADIL
jgi:lipopolysaccharide transport system permease protein